MKLTMVSLISMLTFSLIGNACLANQDTVSPREPQKSVPSRIRISSSIAEAQLIQKVAPVYPPLAKVANVAGTVVLHVIIDKDGVVQQVEFVSGPQLLLTSAMDAVKQWHYKPTLLNGQAVEIDTTVSVVFSLTDDPQTKLSTNSTVDPQLRADLIQFLDVMHYRDLLRRGATETFESSRPQMERAFPDLANKEALIDAYRDKLLEMIQAQELTDALISVYARYLSDDDVKSLIQFFETPAGQHFSSAEGNLTDEISQAVRQVGREHMAEMNREFCGEHQELQGKMPLCPAPASNSAPTN